MLGHERGHIHSHPSPRPAVPQGRLLCVAVVALIGLWIDKGFILVPTAFIPNVFGTIMEYPHTWVELTISIRIYAMGTLIITVFYKVVVSGRNSLSS